MLATVAVAAEEEEEVVVVLWWALLDEAHGCLGEWGQNDILE